MAKSSRTRNKKNASELTSEQREFRGMLWMRGFTLVENLGKWLIIGLTIVGAVYFGVYLPIKISAGKTTTISYIVNFLANINAEVIISWVTSGAAALWAVSERKKRLAERAEKDERLKKLEQRVDPGRSSSHLTPTGQIRAGSDE